jgi:hypothetical protein
MKTQNMNLVQDHTAEKIYNSVEWLNLSGCAPKVLPMMCHFLGLFLAHHAVTTRNSTEFKNFMVSVPTNQTTPAGVPETDIFLSFF